MDRRHRGSVCIGLMALIGAACAGLGLAQPPAEKPGAAHAAVRPFSVEGVYVEACTCKTTCAGEVTGEPTGCDVLGVFRIEKGSFDGQDLSGTGAAFAVDHGDQVHLYLDAPTGRRSTLEAFARAALAPLGTVKGVAAAEIRLEGRDGKYTAIADGGLGKMLKLVTEPVLGGDHKTPVAINNTLNTLNPTLYQGKCISGAYADGEHKITIEKGRNSFFNAAMKQSGTL